MKIVVDTNIVFSAMLNSSGRIGKILINSRQHFNFYSCTFLRYELLKHRFKLQKRTGLSPYELEELEALVTQKIFFINESLIPAPIFSASLQLVSTIDAADTPFVALATHLKAKLWTGDKQLMNGLKAKKYKNIITTSGLSDLLDELEQDI